MEPKPATGLTPLCDMAANDSYKGEDGGLYGNGLNTPPPAHLEKALDAARKIQPLDTNGEPSADGKIALVSISMSNATQEFSRFKQIADADARKSPSVAIIDGAQGGQAMAQWTAPDAPPWNTLRQRLAAAEISDAQVQVAWIKPANIRPSGELQEHGRALHDDTLAVLRNAREKFPNLRIAVLSSRVYGGWAKMPLNPEPYAYEGAFVVRRLIRGQMDGKPGVTDSIPLLLWGPYLWADGIQPRKTDGLAWLQDDFVFTDGTHPSMSGREKVAKLLLDYFTDDPVASLWFVKKD